LLENKPSNLNQITESLKYDAATVSKTLESMIDNKEVERDQQFNFTLNKAL